MISKDELKSLASSEPSPSPTGVVIPDQQKQATNKNSTPEPHKQDIHHENPQPNKKKKIKKPDITGINPVRFDPSQLLS